MRSLGFSLFLTAASLLLSGSVHSAVARDPFPLVVVDKSKNKLFMADYHNETIELKNEMHTTLGKVMGDKQVEKDLKTPEGVYFFITKHEPPALKPKFGAMGLMVNYPNPVDKKLGKTGYDIMVHATDDPSRLERKLDSEGCMVVNNDQVRAIANHVLLGLSPILIYDELKPEYLKANFFPAVKETFNRWLKAWAAKDVDTYISAYAPDFEYNGMKLPAYRQYKKGLTQKYSEIEVRADNVRTYYHPKYNVVTFTQHYSSDLKGGGKGFKSSGTKTLYFNKDNQIVIEAYSNLQES